MDFIEFIDPKLLILVPVLLLAGKAVKDGTHFDSRHIPLILGCMGIILSIAYVLATTAIQSWQEGLLAAFTAFVQGVLCAGAAVYGNQIYKQELNK